MRELKHIRPLVEKLGEEIGNAVYQSESVDEIVRAIHAEGFQVVIAIGTALQLVPIAGSPHDQENDLLKSIRDLDPDIHDPPPE